MKLMFRAARAALLVLSLPAALHAQGEPPRPPVAPGADQNDWEAYFDRGQTLFKSEPAQAHAYFYWASRLEPSRAEPYFALWGNFLFRARNEDIYEMIVGDGRIWERQDVKRADSLRTLAFARNPFVHRGFEAMALDRLPGNFLESRDTRAWIAYSEGRFAQAVEMYSRTIERPGPRQQWARRDRAIAAVSANNLALASTDLQTLIEELRKRDEIEIGLFYSSKGELLYMLGLVRSQMGNRQGARDAMTESVLEDASFAYGHAGVAALARASRQNEAAAAAYATAIELAPDDGQLRYLYAQVLIDLERFESASTEIAAAMRIEPHWAAPHYLLGRLRERQGREAEAYPHYERYVRMAPTKDQIAKNMKLRLELRAKADTTRKAP